MLVGLFPKMAGQLAREEDAERGPYRPRCSAAGVKRCVRADVYHATGTPRAPLPGRARLVFDDGEWHEELSLDWLRQSNWQVHSEQLAVTPFIIEGLHDGYTCKRRVSANQICGVVVPPGGIHGHIDAMLTDPVNRIDYMLEHKAYNPFSWQRWAAGREIPWDIITQTCHYVFGARKLGSDLDKGIVLIKNKASAAFLEMIVDVPRDPRGVVEIESAHYTEGENEKPIDFEQELRFEGLVQASLDRFRAIRRYEKAATVPTRPYSPSNWRCRYCAWAASCWENYEQEITKAEDNVVRFTDDDETLVRDYVHTRQELSVLKKLADSQKERIELRLRESEARSAVVPGGPNGLPIDVEIKVQHRRTIDKDLVPDDVKLVATKFSTFEKLNVKERSNPIVDQEDSSAR
jgi:hypothetical protein